MVIEVLYVVGNYAYVHVILLVFTLLLLLQALDDLQRQQHEEMEQTITDLDNEEAKQFNQLADSVQSDFSQQCTEADNQLAENLANQAQVDEADVQRILKLHKAEMKEFDSKCVLISVSIADLVVYMVSLYG